MTAAPASNYEFSNEWFDQNMPVWRQIIPKFSIQKILEIGSYEGRSTCFLIEAVGSKMPLNIHCIDTWQGGIEHDWKIGAVGNQTVMSAVERRFDRNIEHAKTLVPNPITVTKHKSLSSRGLAALIAADQVSSFDLVYVDGSHQAPDVLSDAVMAFNLLKVGGLMIFDDYLWGQGPRESQDVLNMPKVGVDAFMNVFHRKMEALVGVPVYQLFAKKVAN